VGPVPTTITIVAELTAAESLAKVGDVQRFRTTAQFAIANGTAAVPASSGRTNRHRLNHGGNRQLNRILHLMRSHIIHAAPRDTPTTCASKARDAVNRKQRCLKRRISNRIFLTLRRSPPVTGLACEPRMGCGPAVVGRQNLARE
jgi:transposase